jgi:transcriptional regulator with XRE-family HTH domain
MIIILTMKELPLDAKIAFASNLKRIRKERGMTQVELSEKTNITQSGLSQLEAGTNWPDYNTVEIIAKAFKCEQTDLFKKPTKVK